MTGRSVARAGLAAMLVTVLLAATASPTLAAQAHAAQIGAAQANAAQIGAAPPTQPLQLVLPLNADLAGLKRFALAVSTPGSPLYGQYQSIATLAHRFGAAVGARTRVLDYLRANGAGGVKINATGLLAEATMSVALAERLFGAPLARFRADDGRRFVAPAANPAVPAALRGLVTGVVGLDTRPLVRPAKLQRLLRSERLKARAAAQRSSAITRTGTPRGCAAGIGSGGFTPNQYLTAYDFNPLLTGGVTGAGERVALIEIDGFRYTDITTFAGCFGIGVPALTAYGVGVSHPLKPGAEATLDIEVLHAAAPGLKAIDVYETTPSASDVLRALTAPLQKPGHKPQVVSASLGLCEQDTFGALGVSGIDAAEAQLEMASATGISFLASSGDNGSADCVDQNGNPQHRLAVEYPASSWWVTGVGGTNIALNAANQLAGQIVWNDTNVQVGAGGGGFSFGRGFIRPPYQMGFVARSSRAVPDVSMLADVAPGYAVYCTATPDCISSGSPAPWQTVGGTSAATPLLAGGVALIDQELHAHGKQDLGQMNPLLYALGGSSARTKVFRDVTAFGNDVGPFIPGNGKPLGCCAAGAGFDEASGWGSVDIAQFGQAAILLEPKVVSVSISIPPHQSPIRNHELDVTVSCSDACAVASFADFAIGNAKPFEVHSAEFHLLGPGQKTIPLRFSANKLNKLRTGLDKHKRIRARVFGVLVDTNGDITKATAGNLITLRG